LELEEDDRVDGRAATGGIALRDPLSGEREVEHGLEMAVEVVSGDEILERDRDRAIKNTGLWWTEHGGGQAF
jgi:hypothetical protein